MSIYFFHLRDGADLILDEEGRDCPEHDAIVRMALLDARSIIREDVGTGRIDLNRHLDVKDADGKVVHHLEFTDAIDILSPRKDKTFAH